VALTGFAGVTLFFPLVFATPQVSAASVASPTTAPDQTGAAATSVEPAAPLVPSPRIEPRDEVRYTPPILHALAQLTLQRATEAYLYPEPFARTEPSFWGARYREAFTKPPLFDTSQKPFRWDYDPLKINLLGHGLMGMELYHRARMCRFSVPGALAFTASATVVWEYGFEGNGVRPSAQDLVYTPLAGLVLGEARFQLYQQASRLSSKTARSVLTAVLDPFGELERRTEVFPC
jgi:hypothetical protein